MADQQPADRLAEIRARADAAIPGPWRWEQRGGDDLLVGDLPARHGVPGLVATVLMCKRGWTPTISDRAFVEHSRDDVAWLLAEVDRLRTEWDELATDRTRLILAATDSTGSTVDEAEAAITRARDVQDSMGAESWAQMRRERDQARARLDAVQTRHHRDPDGNCAACIDAYEEPVPWPCPTTRDAHGETETGAQR